MAEPKIDLEETPQSRHRKKIIAEDAKRKAEKTIVATWYEMKGHKLIKRTKTGTGNEYSTYVGTDKRNVEEIKELKAKGLLK